MSRRKRPKRHYVSGHVRNGSWVNGHFRGEKWERVTLGYIVFLSVLWSVFLYFIIDKNAPASPYFLPFAAIMIGIYLVSKAYNPIKKRFIMAKNRTMLPEFHEQLLHQSGFKCLAKSSKYSQYSSFIIKPMEYPLNGNVLFFPDSHRLFATSGGLYFNEPHLSHKVSQRKIPFSHVSTLFEFHLSPSTNWKDDFMSCKVKVTIRAYRNKEDAREIYSLELIDNLSCQKLISFFVNQNIIINMQVSKGYKYKNDLEIIDIGSEYPLEWSRIMFEISKTGATQVSFEQLISRAKAQIYQCHVPSDYLFDLEF